MERQLQPPLLIHSLASTPLQLPETHAHLLPFLGTLGASPARTQLERLTVSLGLQIGFVSHAQEPHGPHGGDGVGAGFDGIDGSASQKRRKRRREGVVPDDEAPSPRAEAIPHPGRDEPRVKQKRSRLEQAGAATLDKEARKKEKKRRRDHVPAVVDWREQMEGGVGDGDVPMDRRGDVEYEDQGLARDDEDEPDNET